MSAIEQARCEEVRLVSDAKRGDARSFEALVDRYMGAAIHVAMSYVRNRDDAVDLAQEAFFRVYKSFDRFRDGEPFAPWFFRILRNACLNFVEKQRRRRHVSISAREEGESDWELPDTGSLCPRDRAELNEAQRRFWIALDELSDKHREIIVLRHVEELEYAQIAAVLDVPVGTVMSRLFHARRRLRGLLEPYLEGLK
ncbi:MAG: sigma-70 family RNA polymerase sigma factor [Planctomycetes bacterium]|nr:sigma-70 family RNA polymerase sigma factor [Planctomycetota bacterium]